MQHCTGRDTPHETPNAQRSSETKGVSITTGSQTTTSDGGFFVRMKVGRSFFYFLFSVLFLKGKE